MRTRQRTRSKVRPQPERLEARVVLSTVVPYPWLSGKLEAHDDGFVLEKDRQVAELSVLANDGDGLHWGSEALRDLEIVSVTKPAHGSIGISEDGKSILYTPKSGYTGIDSFEYTIKSSAGGTDEARAWVNVVEPLFAMDDWYRVEADANETPLDVGQNDSLNVEWFDDRWHPDPTFTVKSVGPASEGGTLSISGDGKQILYTPSLGFSGSETFEYTIEDSDGNAASATVTMEVGPTGGSPSTSQIEHLLLEAAEEKWSHQFGQYEIERHHRWRWGEIIDVSWDGWIFATDTSSSNFSFSTDEDHSGTELQVDGVDEGDIIKTDGDFLYVLSDWFDEQSESMEHQLIIVSVADASAPTVVSRYDFEGDVVEAYLDGDRVTVISQLESQVVVTLLDVSNRSMPELIGESRIDGGLEATRTIGDFLYIVVDAHLADHLPTLETVCGDGDQGCFYETKRQFASRMRNQIRNSLPQVEQRDAAGAVTATESLLENSSLVGFDFSGHDRVSSVVSFDTSASDVALVSSTSLTHGVTGEVYVSREAVYLLEQTWDTASRTRRTGINKLSLATDGSIEWEASGVVEGYVHNRFSVDEHDGYLRVATTTSEWGGDNNLYVLQQSGEQLDVVGSVEGLAKGERIYSARFDGTRGFVVTYRKVDPLFVFDLSDPTDPQALGALKVTGYSNYLQLIDENHLLGIGREANNGGLFQEIQISIFDVSDFSDPKLVHRYGFEGGRQQWSPIMQDAWNLGTHHAVSYFSSAQTLVMPVYEGGSSWSWVRNGQEAEVSMRVLDIDIVDGITSLGRVDFDAPFDPHQARAVRVGDTLFSISPNLIKSNELANPSNQLGEVYIGAGATDDAFMMRGEGTQSFDILGNDLLTRTDERPVISVVQPTRGGTVTVDNDDGSVSFEPEVNFIGPVTFSYTVGAESFRDAAEVTIDVRPLWHNDGDPRDINLDGRTTPIDVLDLVNFVNSKGVGEVEQLESAMISGGTGFGGLRPDADDDGYISSLDLLLLVNYLNSLDLRGAVPGAGFASVGGAEGEAAGAENTEVVDSFFETERVVYDDNRDYGRVSEPDDNDPWHDRRWEDEGPLTSLLESLETSTAVAE